MSRAGFVNMDEARFECVTCGHAIYARRFEGMEWEWQPHYDCDAPKVSMVTHNPRRLGVISAVGEGEPPR